MLSEDTQAMTRCGALKIAAYGLLFLVIIPLLLIIWARRLDVLIPHLPTAGSPGFGAVLMFVGFVIMAAGWHAIIRTGNGLPMNIAPPRKLVTTGIYSIMSHPIYLGFTVLCAGYFLLTALSAGFWIVTPCVALGCTALVWGYERHDLQLRFGTTTWPKSIHFLEADGMIPNVVDRFTAYGWMIVLWFAAYYGLSAFYPSTAVGGQTLLDLSAANWGQLVYLALYLGIIIAPGIARRKRSLRSFPRIGLLGTIAVLFLFLLMPFPSPQLSEQWNRLLFFRYLNDTGSGAFLAIHGLWGWIAAWLYARDRSHPVLWYLVFAVAMSMPFLGAPTSLIYPGIGVVLFFVALNRPRIWNTILQATEWIANSWQEWRIGPVRILLHSVYSWAAAFVGIALAMHLTGPNEAGNIVLIGVCAILGAGTWGQFLKGNANLARPFGFFGGVIGGAIGVFLVSALSGNGWLLAGSLAVALPFIQAVGRLRCLVQGCCHGRQCDPSRGIVVTTKKSRVTYLAHLDHRPIHPTPLYSIAYNLIIGPLLLRFWTISLPLPFIIGMYLVLGGMGRFVEEAYRGVPHTQRFYRLSIYQWLSVAGIATGAALTTVRGPDYSHSINWLPVAFLYAALFGLFTAFALSTDFPKSSRRFSRLAPR